MSNEPENLSDYLKRNPIDLSGGERDEYIPDATGDHGIHSSGVDDSPAVEGDAVGKPDEGSGGTVDPPEGRGDENLSATQFNPALNPANSFPGLQSSGAHAAIVDEARNHDEVRASAPSPSGRDAGTVGGGDKDKPAKGEPASDATDPDRRARFLANARRWLTTGVEGQQELYSYMKENLVVNMQYDQEEGQDVRNSESKSAATQARANRKQFKETSELVMAIVAAQNEEAKKVGK